MFAAGLTGNVYFRFGVKETAIKMIFPQTGSLFCYKSQPSLSR